MKQESVPATERRLRRYTNPARLVLDESGYVPCGSRAADLLFHLLVLLRLRGLPLAELWTELDGRFGGPTRIPAPRASDHPHS